MDQIEQEKIAEILDKVSNMPDTSLLFLGVIAFIFLGLGFIWVIGKLISLQAAQAKTNAEIAASQQGLMVESNRQTELMRMAFDQHNNLERERNRVMEAQGETLRGLQSTFLEKLPQLLEAAQILNELVNQVGEQNQTGREIQLELKQSQLELRKLSSQVILLVGYTEETRNHQKFIDTTTSNLALAFISLEDRIVKALGIAAVEALSAGDTGPLKPVYIPPETPMKSPSNLTNLGE